MPDLFQPSGRGDDRQRFEGVFPVLQAPWQALSELFPRERRTGPSVEVAEDGGDVVVRVELPGVKPDEAHVWITDDRVTVRGERRHEQKTERQGYFHTERQYGSFHRVIPLPAAVDSDKAEARFEHGVLEVKAPKRDPQQEQYGRRLPFQ